MADLFSIFVPLKSGGENRMRRLIFGTVIGSLVAVAAVAAAIFYYERPNVLRIAVPRDSDDQAIMAAAAHDFAEARDGIRLKLVAVESRGGPDSRPIFAALSANRRTFLRPPCRCRAFRD